MKLFVVMFAFFACMSIVASISVRDIRYHNVTNPQNILASDGQFVSPTTGGMCGGVYPPNPPSSFICSVLNGPCPIGPDFTYDPLTNYCTHTPSGTVITSGWEQINLSVTEFSPSVITLRSKASSVCRGSCAVARGSSCTALFVSSTSATPTTSWRYVGTVTNTYSIFGSPFVTTELPNVGNVRAIAIAEIPSRSARQPLWDYLDVAYNVPE